MSFQELSKIALKRNGMERLWRSNKKKSCLCTSCGNNAVEEQYSIPYCNFCISKNTADEEPARSVFQDSKHAHCFYCLLLQVNLTQNTKTTSHQKWRQPHQKMKTASPRKLRLSHPKKQSHTKYEDDLFWAYTKFAATLLKSHLFRFLWPLPGGQGHHNFNMSVCLFYHLFLPDVARHRKT